MTNAACFIVLLATCSALTNGGRAPQVDVVPAVAIEVVLSAGSEAASGTFVAGDGDECPVFEASHTDAGFSGGSFVAQVGFAEQEIAAASYVIASDAFPIQIDLVEVIVATAFASVSTTTHWSLFVWEGTPAAGKLVASFSSDGVTLPHIFLPPGTGGVNLQLSVDPKSASQIVIDDDGSQTFSIGFRVDQHHAQTADPCSTAPPFSSNAFPATDVSGVSSATGNWLFGLDCGGFGCPPDGGWESFQGLGFCQPSGDWVMRASWFSLPCGVPCPADLNGNGTVEFSDLVALLSVWGPCVGVCPADLDGNSDVGFTDLVALLAVWGPCP